MMKFASFFAVLSLFLPLIVQDVNAFTVTPRATITTKKGTFQTLQSATRSDDDEFDSNTMIYSRRNAMREGLFKTAGVAAAAALVVATPNAALADIYDEQEKARKIKAKEDAENGKKKIPYILGGGFLLSLPFFLPNLLRLGKKLGSGGKDDGYGN
mmetsp:Transcript_11666/g.12531  ORF Transcript_11666/g.12531 Transcript_11666/m.12531 type:complete len:156 (-) Transcript_11666:104-571(-)